MRCQSKSHLPVPSVNSELGEHYSLKSPGVTAAPRHPLFAAQSGRGLCPRSRTVAELGDSLAPGSPTPAAAQGLPLRLHPPPNSSTESLLR